MSVKTIDLILRKRSLCFLRTCCFHYFGVCDVAAAAATTAAAALQFGRNRGDCQSFGEKKQKFKTLENVNVPEKAVSLHDH